MQASESDVRSSCVTPFCVCRRAPELGALRSRRESPAAGAADRPGHRQARGPPRIASPFDRTVYVYFSNVHRQTHRKDGLVRNCSASCLHIIMLRVRDLGWRLIPSHRSLQNRRLSQSRSAGHDSDLCDRTHA